MCCTPHDYRITGYVERYDDYRGLDPMYRAGSILGHGANQTYIGDAYYVGSTGDYFNNAGNYGVTTPVSTVPPSLGPIEITHPGHEQIIGIPERAPENGGGIIETPGRGNGSRVPTLDDLLGPRGMLPTPQPIITPPTRPNVIPPSLDDDAPIPFAPGDALDGEPVAPPKTAPTKSESDPPITLEELRRLDPSIQDVQIISIEDAGLETFLK
jgi:hypothetical protein